MKKLFSILFLFTLAITPASAKKKVEVVEIKTQYGNIYLWLYKDTPKHRKNFLKLARAGFYDGTTFHRVIQGFMIQGGDPYSKTEAKKDSVGEGGPGYELPAEIKHVHKRGALAAARNGDETNPGRKSSGSQFYIVQGRKYTDVMLDQTEVRINDWLRNNIFCRILWEPQNRLYREKYIGFAMANRQDSLQAIRKRFDAEVEAQWQKTEKFKFTPAQREMYKTTGGAAHLDANYTVFGEVLQGMEVVDQVAAVATNPMAKPLKDIIMQVSVLKMSVKDFQDRFGTLPPTH